MHRFLMLLPMLLLACGGVVSPFEEEPRPTVIALPCDDAGTPTRVGADAGATFKQDAPDAASLPDSAPAPDDACKPNAFTQLTCFATLTPDAGTSHTTGCEHNDGCTLVEDDAGANPPVWCCP